MHQPAGNLQPAPHAPGKHLDRFVSPLRQIHRFQEPADDLAALIARNVVELCEYRHVLDWR